MGRAWIRKGCEWLIVRQDYRAILLRNELSASDRHYQRMSVSMG